MPDPALALGGCFDTHHYHSVPSPLRYVTFTSEHTPFLSSLLLIIKGQLLSVTYAQLSFRPFIIYLPGGQ